MGSGNVLEAAREAVCLSQAALALRAGSSRPTLSAYENDRKSPTPVERVVAAAGGELAITPRIEFREVATDRGRSVQVSNVLPRLPIHQALATVELPLHLNWSERGRRYHVRDRRQRARVDEIVLREGGPQDVLDHIDGALLVDIRDDLVLPVMGGAAWQPVVTGDSVGQAA